MSEHCAIQVLIFKDDAVVKAKEKLRDDLGQEKYEGFESVINDLTEIFVCAACKPMYKPDFIEFIPTGYN